MICCFFFYIVLLFVVYKVIDRLIRLPRIGRYEDRYILVTGCDTGFGNLLAKRLDELGCHVFAGCFTEKGEVDLKKTSSERLHAFPLDVTKPESVQNAFDFVKSKLPPEKGLWGVMNNAGVISYCGPPDWVHLEDYKRQCDVNLWGLIDVSLKFMPLVKKEKGRIVNTASIAGRLSFPLVLPYSIAKTGVEVFTDGIRRSLRVFGCKAIIIEPGAHKTFLMSAENWADGYRRIFNDADPQVREEYGEEYFKYLTSPLGLGKLLSIGSERLTDVVDAYEHALLGLFPRARYMVGRDAVFIYLPIQWLPEWLGDWVFAKLDTDLPLPAALAKKA